MGVVIKISGKREQISFYSFNILNPFSRWFYCCISFHSDMFYCIHFNSLSFHVFPCSKKITFQNEISLDVKDILFLKLCLVLISQFYHDLKKWLKFKLYLLLYYQPVYLLKLALTSIYKLCLLSTVFLWIQINIHFCI